MRMNIETGLAVTDAMVHVTNVLSIDSTPKLLRRWRIFQRAWEVD